MYDDYTWAIAVNSYILVMIAVVIEAFWAGDQSWFCTRASDIVQPDFSSSKSIAAREKKHGIVQFVYSMSSWLKSYSTIFLLHQSFNKGRLMPHTTV